MTGKFKSKGENILRPGPGSMEDFLNDTQNHKATIPKLHKSTDTQSSNSADDHIFQDANHQKHKTTKTQTHKLCRLHIQIRQDLADRLLDLVFKRKLDPNIKNRNASQRVIIEEALVNYFKYEAKQK